MPGVEFAAELRDFVNNEIAKQYPKIKDKIKVTLIGGYRGVLSTYDGEVRLYKIALLSLPKAKFIRQSPLYFIPLLVVIWLFHSPFSGQNMVIDKEP